MSLLHGISALVPIWKRGFFLRQNIAMRHATRVLKKTTAPFHTKLKCFSRDFQIPVDGRSDFLRTFSLHPLYDLRSAAKYSSGERFPLRGFQIQSPDAPTVFTRISTANCSFSVYGTLKSFWRLCRIKKSINGAAILFSRIKPLMMYFLEMSGKLILLLVIPW